MTAASPIVIAHRGASGYLPEHSIEAKLLAYGMSADFLEQDVIATRDGELVVLHDLYLDDVSDVRARFPGRARRDGRHYVVDFDLAELETLRFHERRRSGGAERVYPNRFAADHIGFAVVPLRAELQLIQALNQSTGRCVGVYPEIKDPRWHHEHGFDLARALVALLEELGYTGPDAPVFVQCFDAHELARTRNELGCRLKLVQLIAARDSADSLSATGLERISAYADAVGPPYEVLMRLRRGGARPDSSVQRIHEAGLALHPYTFRRDALPAGLPFDFDALLEFFLREVGVQGLFTDHPDHAIRVRNTIAGTP